MSARKTSSIYWFKIEFTYNVSPDVFTTGFIESYSISGAIIRFKTEQPNEILISCTKV